IDPRGFAGVLNAVASHLTSSQPLWTVMVVNQSTGRPSSGFWQADYPDTRYQGVAKLSDVRIDAWLKTQQDRWIAMGRLIDRPLDQALRDLEIEARERADLSIIDLQLEQFREDR